MEYRSPVTPLPGVSRPLNEPGVFRRAELIAIESSRATPVAPAGRRDSRAAIALVVGAAAVAADIVVRPLLAPEILPHPVVQWSVAAALVGTAIGVQRGWRPARRLARLLGYAIGAGSFLALSRLPSFATVDGWWVAGLWALEAVSLGYVLQRLGWAGDEE
jgi:hypothetical protein